jgi:fluoroquinolone transport system ATP-binding protein
MIRVENLTYTYPRTAAETLHGLNFEIAEGEIFGFLGPSGAGKSTTQKILIGLLKSYGGRVEVMGRSVGDWGQDYYEHIGVSFEMPNHYLKLTALENLAYFQSLYRNRQRDPREVLAWVGLQDEAKKRVAEFSKGMKIRLNVARSLLHEPKVLFLDEPTNGLDPMNARRIKDLLFEVRRHGATVFVTTHDMGVADELCDRVGFITDGAIKVVDAPSALKKRHGKRMVRVEYLDSALHPAQQEFPLEGLGTNGAFLLLLQSAHRVETIHTLETTLERVFIEVTGEGLMT